VGEPAWTGSLSSPPGAVARLPSLALASVHQGRWVVRSTPPPPSGWLPFSTVDGFVGVPLSRAASGGSCSSAIAGRCSGASCGGACFPSKSHCPGAASAPPSLATHKRALREVHAKAAAGGVFPFVTGLEPMIEVNPNLFFVLD
jgi:hypothetical protein